MAYRELTHTITLFNKYVENRETAYKRTVIENCKFTPKKAVVLGNVKVQDADTGKLFVYEKDLNMEDYVKPHQYDGVGFTFNHEDIIAVGVAPEIIGVKDLAEFEHYTISSVLHNDYSLVLPHHFSIEVK